MLKSKDILYFTPYIFDNGTPSKPKYFIVLHVDASEVILATLPTSKDHVPNQIIKKHGCINNPAMMFNCYYFEKERAVCTNGFAFPRDTYVYAEEVGAFSKEKMLQYYPEEGIDYTKIGILTDDEFKGILNCFKVSKNLKRGIRRQLFAN